MTDEELRSLEIGALGEPELRQLVDAGETVAERKAAVPSEGLGPTFASFANSGGGWVLLGISDDGSPCGFKVPGRVEPQEWLRSKMRIAVDPLPPFRCREMVLDGCDVLVVRVGASAETPHLVKSTGAVLVREPGGRAPIASQAKLLELCVRPEVAEQRAIERMTRLPLVVEALGPRAVGALVIGGQNRVSDWAIAASPLTLPEDFRIRCLGREQVRAQRAVVLKRAAELGAADQAVVEVRPHATGVIIEGGNFATGNSVGLCLDAGGVAVGHVRHTLEQGSWHVGQTADEVMTPLLTLTLEALDACGVTGRALIHLYVRVSPLVRGIEPVLSLYTAHSRGELSAPAAEPRFFGGDIRLPATPDHVRALSEQLMREIARTANIDWWE